ncbi:hypothetical protein [Silvimonas soli]|uniref:hypothetical protein n=1 Tax=Silvimonas soli TaxID=2980100 RepID=UPI0024B34267|nr:hypothetical protein [Silvimonas soli]
MLCRLSLAGMLCASLMAPAHADMIDDVATLEAILDSVCGQRFEVIWVDQEHKLPPCMMSYSPYCEEIQNNTADSCVMVMGTTDSADTDQQDSPDVLAASTQGI